MIPRASMRRPEEVKFRTKDEEKAADEINQEGTRRENSADSKVVNLESFEILGMMGQGAYGKVFLIQKKKGGKYYALKAISKHKIMQEKKQHEVFRERQALLTLDHPNIVRMHWSFNVRNLPGNGYFNESGKSVLFIYQDTWCL